MASQAVLLHYYRTGFGSNSTELNITSILPLYQHTTFLHLQGLAIITIYVLCSVYAYSQRPYARAARTYISSTPYIPILAAAPTLLGHTLCAQALTTLTLSDLNGGSTTLNAGAGLSPPSRIEPHPVCTINNTNLAQWLRDWGCQEPAQCAGRPRTVTPTNPSNKYRNLLYWQHISRNPRYWTYYLRAGYKHTPQSFLLKRQRQYGAVQHMRTVMRDWRSAYRLFYSGVRPPCPDTPEFRRWRQQTLDSVRCPYPPKRPPQLFTSSQTTVRQRTAQYRLPQTIKQERVGGEALYQRAFKDWWFRAIRSAGRRHSTTCPQYRRWFVPKCWIFRHRSLNNRAFHSTRTAPWFRAKTYPPHNIIEREGQYTVTAKRLWAFTAGSSNPATAIPRLVKTNHYTVGGYEAPPSKYQTSIAKRRTTSLVGGGAWWHSYSTRIKQICAFPVTSTRRCPSTQTFPTPQVESLIYWVRLGPAGVAYSLKRPRPVVPYHPTTRLDHISNQVFTLQALKEGFSKIMWILMPECISEPFCALFEALAEIWSKKVLRFLGFCWYRLPKDMAPQPHVFSLAQRAWLWGFNYKWGKVPIDKLRGPAAEPHPLYTYSGTHRQNLSSLLRHERQLSRWEAVRLYHTTQDAPPHHPLLVRRIRLTAVFRRWDWRHQCRACLLKRMGAPRHQYRIGVLQKLRLPKRQVWEAKKIPTPPNPVDRTPAPNWQVLDDFINWKVDPPFRFYQNAGIFTIRLARKYLGAYPRHSCGFQHPNCFLCSDHTLGLHTLRWKAAGMVLWSRKGANIWRTRSTRHIPMANRRARRRVGTHAHSSWDPKQKQYWFRTSPLSVKKTRRTTRQPFYKRALNKASVEDLAYYHRLNRHWKFWETPSIVWWTGQDVDKGDRGWHPQHQFPAIRRRILQGDPRGTFPAQAHFRFYQHPRGPGSYEEIYKHRFVHALPRRVPYVWPLSYMFGSYMRPKIYGMNPPSSFIISQRTNRIGTFARRGYNPTYRYDTRITQPSHLHLYTFLMGLGYSKTNTRIPYYASTHRRIAGIKYARLERRAPDNPRASVIDPVRLFTERPTAANSEIERLVLHPLPTLRERLWEVRKRQRWVSLIPTTRYRAHFWTKLYPRLPKKDGRLHTYTAAPKPYSNPSWPELIRGARYKALADVVVSKLGRRRLGPPKALLSKTHYQLREFFGVGAGRRLDGLQGRIVTGSPELAAWAGRLYTNSTTCNRSICRLTHLSYLRPRRLLFQNFQAVKTYLDPHKLVIYNSPHRAKVFIPYWYTRPGPLVLKWWNRSAPSAQSPPRHRFVIKGNFYLRLRRDLQRSPTREGPFTKPATPVHALRKVKRGLIAVGLGPRPGCNHPWRKQTRLTHLPYYDSRITRLTQRPLHAHTALAWWLGKLAWRQDPLTPTSNDSSLSRYHPAPADTLLHKAPETGVALDEVRKVQSVNYPGFSYGTATGTRTISLVFGFKHLSRKHLHRPHYTPAIPPRGTSSLIPDQVYVGEARPLKGWPTGNLERSIQLMRVGWYHYWWRRLVKDPLYRVLLHIYNPYIFAGRVVEVCYLWLPQFPNLATFVRWAQTFLVRRGDWCVWSPYNGPSSWCEGRVFHTQWWILTTWDSVWQGQWRCYAKAATPFIVSLCCLPARCAEAFFTVSLRPFHNVPNLSLQSFIGPFIDSKDVLPYPHPPATLKHKLVLALSTLVICAGLTLAHLKWQDARYERAVAAAQPPTQTLGVQFLARTVQLLWPPAANLPIWQSLSAPRLVMQCWLGYCTKLRDHLTLGVVYVLIVPPVLVSQIADIVLVPYYQHRPRFETFRAYMFTHLKWRLIRHACFYFSCIALLGIKSSLIFGGCVLTQVYVLLSMCLRALQAATAPLLTIRLGLLNMYWCDLILHSTRLGLWFWGTAIRLTMVVWICAINLCHLITISTALSVLRLYHFVTQLIRLLFQCWASATWTVAYLLAHTSVNAIRVINGTVQRYFTVRVPDPSPPFWHFVVDCANMFIFGLQLLLQVVRRVLDLVHFWTQVLLIVIFFVTPYVFWVGRVTILAYYYVGCTILRVAQCVITSAPAHIAYGIGAWVTSECLLFRAVLRGSFYWGRFGLETLYRSWCWMLASLEQV